jgi:hypothetical protein
MLLRNGSTNAHAAPCASAVPCRRLSLSRLPSRPSFFTQLAEPSLASRSFSSAYHEYLNHT